MAKFSISLNVGQTEFSIVEGTDAPVTGDIELSVDLAKLPGNSGGAWAPNSALLQVLDMFRNYVTGGKSRKIG
ncbi:hypothetical protein [Candidatus Binatus sp.]|uniref:hypothetical protein n=1 Tax=Candidatus Binatus sp. TaxID=2811406 RepID=UPI003C541EF7